VTPDGKTLLSAFQELPPGVSPTSEAMTKGLLTAIQEALHKVGSLPPRPIAHFQLNPDRGIGFRSDGSIRTALTVRYVFNGKPEGDPMLDSVVLTAAQQQAFAPPQRTVGARYTLPDAVSRLFVRALSPASDLSTMPTPQDARTAHLTAEVTAIHQEQARIRLTGNWQAVHLSEGDATRPIQAAATADGILEYDLRRRRMRSLLLVMDGTYRLFPPYDSLQHTGAVVEWQAGSAPVRP
jgi:hypothetical protein